MTENKIKNVGIGLLGFGTIGQGVARMLEEREEELTRRIGTRIQVVMAASKDWSNLDPDTPLPQRKADDALTVVQDDKVDLVVELMGGLEPARTMILKSLELGKPVVTANKAVLAVHGDELFAMAEKTGVPLRYEASVGGAIPILRTLTEGLAGDEVQSVQGILNGTCNYILTRIQDEGAPLAEVLADAQRLGYAEADPSADIDGWDTAHKIAVIARIAFESSLAPDQMSVRGIRAVDRRDIAAAQELGFVLRLVGSLQRHGSKLEAHVEPILVPLDHALANATGVLNAVMVHGKYAGDLFLMGSGAGAHPTANSVVGDILALVQRGLKEPRSLDLGYRSSSAKRLEIAHDPVRRHYFRVNLANRTGVLAETTALCGEHGINISSVLQHGEKRQPDGLPIPVIFTTTAVADSAIRTLLADLETENLTHGDVAWYPILHN